MSGASPRIATAKAARRVLGCTGSTDPTQSGMMIPAMEAHNIGEILGGRRVLGASVTSLLQLSNVVERGLPKATLRNVAKRIFEDAADQRAIMFRIVPEATYKRRRERLSPVESERTERMARVVALAEEVWQDREQTRRFLTTPHPELGGRAPLEAALTELGARQAEQVMARILYGLPA